MKTLIEEFTELPIPESSSEYAFSAFRLNKEFSHRIGKNNVGAPSLLLETSGNNYFTVAHQKLYNIAIHHNLSCIIVSDSDSSEHQLSLISFLGLDETLQHYFLRICEILCASLNSSPTSDEINDVTNKFIDLFRALIEPPQKTIQGLWAELFVIHQSENAAKLIRAWHAIPEEAYDFSSASIRLEVKSSGSRVRAHHFSVAQLSPPRGCQLYIASLFAVLSSGGMSITQLMEEINERLVEEPMAFEKMNLQVLATLGNEIFKMDEQCFDYQLAVDSLRLYLSEDIPTITNIPLSVSDVRFRSSLERVEPSVVCLSEIM